MSEAVGEQAIGLEKSGEMVWLLSLLGLAIALPFFHLQMVTGPLVNAILFIATVVLGWRQAVWVALLPSALAYAVGLLPMAMGPMIPFILLGNIVLVVVFNGLWRKNYWLGVAAASAVKFLFLLAASHLLFGLILRAPLAPAIAAMMSWPQLYSALLGGIIAYIFLKSVKRI